jgi:hypothetical protein
MIDGLAAIPPAAMPTKAKMRRARIAWMAEWRMAWHGGNYGLLQIPFSQLFGKEIYNAL